MVVDSIVVQTSTVTWKTNSTSYSIENDPETEDVFIKFKSDMDLYCYNTVGNNVDTFVVMNTTGVCYPIKKIWQGEYGTVTWEQAGLEPEKYLQNLINMKLI